MVHQTVPFRRRMSFAKRPIVSTKNITDISGVNPALTNSVLETLIEANTISNSALTTANAISRSSKVNGIYLSLFYALDVNQTAPSSVPLMDWYILIDQGGILADTPSFGDGPTQLPIPGATGTSINKNKILHEQKGLIGEKNDGSKMVFEGVIKIPRGKQRFGAGTKLIICARNNFDVVFCIKSIYKWYE